MQTPSSVSRKASSSVADRNMDKNVEKSVGASTQPCLTDPVCDTERFRDCNTNIRHHSGILANVGVGGEVSESFRVTKNANDD